ncbi:MAG TPA: DinB family protein [Candidatus Eisenbacteria bacterium]|jgi:uncharacterized damage-inducible protein DinB|nr:DinB family protein [Candidatus Eisenbacteria bacterium]
MNLAYTRTLWEELRLVNGITLRVIDAIPADKIDAHPIPNMRTPKELVVHMAETMRGCSTGAIQGKITNFEEHEPAKVAAITTKDAMVAAMRSAWNEADAAVKSMTESQATAKVETPWGFNPWGWLCIQIIFDEHLHHRGQLYAYARALGVPEVPFMWDFEHNAPEFRPNPNLQPA